MQVARHGNMIVGRTGSGKSEAWKALQRALGRLRKEAPDDERFQKVNVYTINPLALSNDELYGSFDQVGLTGCHGAAWLAARRVRGQVATLLLVSHPCRV
jgi:hypothetical protein